MDRRENPLTQALGETPDSLAILADSRRRLRQTSLKAAERLDRVTAELIHLRARVAELEAASAAHRSDLTPRT